MATEPSATQRDRPTTPLIFGEPTALNASHDTAFPFDDAQTIQRALRNARREIEHVLAGITVLDGLYGVMPEEQASAAPGISSLSACSHAKFHPNGCPEEPIPAERPIRQGTAFKIERQDRPGGSQNPPGGKTWKR